jgi:hypothetical protein
MKFLTILMLLVCLFFISSSLPRRQAGLYSSHSYFSTSGQVKENVLSASDWHTPEEAIEEINDVLESTASALYQLVDESFKETFSQEEFEAAVAAAGIEIEQVMVVEEPRIFGVDGEWAEAVLEISVSDGASQKFRVIFKKEDGLWRIFGTEEL